MWQHRPVMLVRLARKHAPKLAGAACHLQRVGWGVEVIDGSLARLNGMWLNGMWLCGWVPSSMMGCSRETRHGAH